MRIPPRAAAVLALGLALPAAAAAQATVTLGVGSSGVTSNSAGASIALSGSNTTLQVSCAPPLACNTLSLLVTGPGGTGPVAAGPASATAAQFTLNASMLNGQPSGTLVINTPSAQVGTVPLQGGAATPPPDTTSVPTSLGTLLTADCRAPMARTYGDAVLYDERANWAQFVVTPVGNVILTPGEVVDEGDEVRVVVVGDSRIVSRLKVTRQSAFRTPGAFNLVGSGSSIGFNFKDAVQCDSAAFVLRDFAPGQGQVQIALIGDDGSLTNTGAFDFGVNTLYAGAFSLGAFRTELRDPTFGIAAVGADSVVTETADGTPRVLYALQYTPFVWGPRDLEKAGPWYTHVNPSVGVVLSDITSNAVAGVTVDLMNSLYLNVGVHAGRVTRLDPRSGLRLGDPFDGEAAAIPTVTEWGTDWFVGITLDLRAASQLLKTAVSGQGS